MKFLNSIFETCWKAALCGVLLAFGMVATVQAADPAPTPASTLASAPSLVGMTRAQKDAVCTRCHDDTETKPILSIYQTRHGAIGDPKAPACQDCHGASEKHLAGNVSGGGRPRPDKIFGIKRTAAGYEPDSTQDQSETCLSCHKAGARMHWPGSEHDANEVTCANCHTLHNPVDKVRVKAEQPEVCFNCHKEQRALIKKISAHPIGVGKMACSDCHNPHGSASNHLMKQNTVNETCFLCHADKRGPFTWEHQPVNENCAECHNPHGSNLTPLLKSRAPFLCLDCHNGPHDSSQAGVLGSQAGGRQVQGPTAGLSDFAVGRACLQCHVMVHGSNSPAGQGFTR
jgi:DmsE family decaheme c-type cytochrome